MTLKTLPCGPRAVMIEVESVHHAAALAAVLQQASVTADGVRDIVPAARTVLVECVDEAARLRVEHGLQTFEITVGDTADGVVVEVPTIYDGEDLAHVAAATGQSVAEVIAAHAAAEYRAAFCGFTPGFAYLTGLDDRLHLPRRSDPRSRVPAGSVAIGAHYTGVYPTDSPGGWHLLGRVTVQMWDPQRARPAFVEPGDRVRFVPVSP